MCILESVTHGSLVFNHMCQELEIINMQNTEA